REPVRVVEVVAALGVEEIRVQEGVEDELAREPEKIERTGAVLVHEGADRAPVLAEHDLRLRPRPVRRIVAEATELVDEPLLAGPDAGQAEPPEALAHRRGGGRRGPGGRFHHVRGGVGEDATLGVRHDDLLPRSRPGAGAVARGRRCPRSGSTSAGRRSRAWCSATVSSRSTACGSRPNGSGATPTSWSASPRWRPSSVGSRPP